jgi:hypothetical protein
MLDAICKAEYGHLGRVSKPAASACQSGGGLLPVGGLLCVIYTSRHRWCLQIYTFPLCHAVQDYGEDEMGLDISALKQV